MKKRPRVVWLRLVLAALLVVWFIRKLPALRREWIAGKMQGAVESGNGEKLRELLESGVSPNTVVGSSFHGGRHQKSIITLAAKEGNLEAVRMLHSYGADLRKTSGDGDSLLVKIMNIEDHNQTVGHWQCFVYLAKIRDAVTQADAGGQTPLQFAVWLGLATKYTEMLLKQGADPNRNGANGWPPLYSLARDGLKGSHRTELRKAENAELLLKYGADVNWLSSDGETALDVARQGGHEELATVLLSHGGKSGEELSPGVETEEDDPSYHCSLHPNVKTDRPGRCPKCQLGLVPAGEEDGRALPSARARE
jgi:hypothetical protein